MLLRLISVIVLALSAVSKVQFDCQRSFTCDGTNRCIFYNNTWKGVCVHVCQADGDCRQPGTRCVPLYSFKKRRQWKVCAAEELIRAQANHFLLAKSWTE